MQPACTPEAVFNDFVTKIGHPLPSAAIAPIATNIDDFRTPKPEHIRMRPCILQRVCKIGNNFWPHVKADTDTLQRDHKLHLSATQLWTHNAKFAPAGFAIIEQAFKKQGWIVTIDAVTMRITEPEPTIDDTIKARAIQIHGIMCGQRV